MRANKSDVRWPAGLSGADDRSSATSRTLLAALLATCASVAIPAVPQLSAARAERPQPPYPRFAGVTFEPSAAAFDPASRRVLVLSDKDSTLYRYEITAAGLVLPPGERHDPLRLPEGMQAAKFEGLTRRPSGDFLAVTAFDRPDPRYHRLLRFSFAPDGLADAVPLALDGDALAAAVRAASGLPWFKIEALAVDRTGEKVLFGVRNVGESYEAPRDVVLLVRCPLAGDRVGLPEAVIRLSTAAALGGVEEGLSDLQLDAGGDSFLLLTSHEATTGNDPEGHAGHLFRVPAAVFLGTPAPGVLPLSAPLRGWRAKPEGLAVLPKGALVVVFDDDREWKHLFAGYEQSEGLFTLIDPRP
jgi:hypothetical protein